MPIDDTDRLVQQPLFLPLSAASTHLVQQIDLEKRLHSYSRGYRLFDDSFARLRKFCLHQPLAETVSLHEYKRLESAPLLTTVYEGMGAESKGLLQQPHVPFAAGMYCPWMTFMRIWALVFML